jgi:myo-inositol-1(or 4)-monophosphatase
MEDKGEPKIEHLEDFGRQILSRCGQQALKHYRGVKPHERFDEDLVTEAELDLASCFQTSLRETFPAHQVFDGDDRQEGYTHEQKRYLWIFDPVDGLDNFQAGIPVWAMSLGLMENYWPLLGMIFMPATGDLFHARAGGQAFLGSHPLTVESGRAVDEERLILTFSRFHCHYRTDFPGKIRNLGCTAAHLCYVAMGRADAALVTNESFKDLAAAAVIIEAAGGRIFTMRGAPFHVGDHLDGRKIMDHLIATHPDRLDTILSYLHRLK